MRAIYIECVLNVFDTISQLPDEASKLMNRAVDARKKAYAPYSNFQVGAAVELDNGEIVTGNNQENASFPLGLCAERTAIHYAGATHPNSKIIRMAISASSNIEKTLKPIPPCGACRQAIAEYEIKQKSPIEIYFMGEAGEILMSQSLANILPLAFDGSILH